jgi:hypothetical protein
LSESTTRFFKKGFRVNKRILLNRMAARKRRLARRLDKFNFPANLGEPVLRATNIQYELAERSVGTSYGGIGLVHQLVREIGLAEEINSRLHLLKINLPYRESDHVLNLAYNALCAGSCLQDLELRRQDEAYLNALGAERIPDPTTAGDFCRRFQRSDLGDLQAAIDAARLKIWARQPAEFFREAILEADGILVETDAECKQGIDYSYKGVWGYHPLVLTLANTGESLRLINRSGNRPSHEGAAGKFDECITLCRQAGFQKITLRGDTDFSQTQHLDRWHEQGVKFLFGYDCTGSLEALADELPDSAWKPLVRPSRYEVKNRASRAARAGEAADRRAARLQGRSPDRRGSGGDSLSSHGLQTHLSADHRPQEPDHQRTPGIAVVRRLQVLFLHHQ